MPRKSAQIKQIHGDGSFRKEDSGKVRSTKDQTGDDSASLLEDIDRLEKEASNLRQDISHLHAKLISTQPKLYDDEASSPSRTSNMQNYSIKMSHKFYEFTGASVKRATDDAMTVCFYSRHDDWSDVARPYWLKVRRTGESPAVLAYDLPFMVDMSEMQSGRPMSSDADLFAFADHVRRLIEAYFERRQQAHELEECLNPAHAKVFMNMHYTLIQIKLLARKSKPEMQFSIWYRDDATLPHKCVVRILDGRHEDLIKKLTMELTVLNTKPLPEAFIEGMQKYINLESSSEESSPESDDSDTTDLESWFLPLQTGIRKKSRAVGISSRTKRGRKKAVGKGTSEDDDDTLDSSVSRQPLAKRSRKLNKTYLIDGNDKDVDDSTPLQRKSRTSKYHINMKGGNSTQQEVVPKVSTRKRVDTPGKYDVINWRKSYSSLPRKSQQPGESVRSEVAEKRNSSNAVKNVSMKSKNTQEKVDVRKSPKKSVYFNLSESSGRNTGTGRFTKLQQQAQTSQSSPSGLRNSRQSSMTNFLKPIGDSKAITSMSNTPTPRERNIQPVIYENEFESDGSDDLVSLHSAETVTREPRFAKQ